MINEYIPPHCGEIIERREDERAKVRNAALFQAAMNEAFTTELHLFGQVSDETKEKANQAGKAYNDAIRAILGNNVELRNATQY